MAVVMAYSRFMMGIADEDSSTVIAKKTYCFN